MIFDAAPFLYNWSPTIILSSKIHVGLPSFLIPAPRTIMQSASKFLHFSTVTILLFTEPVTYKLIPTTANVPITPKNIITHKIFIIILFFPFFIISPLRKKEFIFGKTNS